MKNITDPIKYKSDLKKVLINNLQEKLKDTLESANSAHGGATHSDAIAKSKYDTHGLELSYLAGSLFERAKSLELAITRLNAWKVINQVNCPVDRGCLIRCSNNKTYLLVDGGAGEVLTHKENTIQVITPESPLGSELLGLYEEDEIQDGKVVITAIW